MGVRVAPLPLHAAIVQRTRRRALNPEAGVQLPVAVLDARSSNRKDLGLLLRLWGFEPSSGSLRPHATRNDNEKGVTMPINVNDKLISWATDIDQETIRQAEKTARLPIVEGHVALMPDAHKGIGATVGSVIPTKNAVIPSAVGAKPTESPTSGREPAR